MPWSRNTTASIASWLVADPQAKAAANSRTQSRLEELDIRLGFGVLRQFSGIGHDARAHLEARRPSWANIGCDGGRACETLVEC